MAAHGPYVPVRVALCVLPAPSLPAHVQPVEGPHVQLSLHRGLVLFSGDLIDARQGLRERCVEHYPNPLAVEEAEDLGNSFWFRPPDPRGVYHHNPRPFHSLLDWEQERFTPPPPIDPLHLPRPPESTDHTSPARIMKTVRGGRRRQQTFQALGLTKGTRCPLPMAFSRKNSKERPPRGAHPDHGYHCITIFSRPDIIIPSRPWWEYAGPHPHGYD